MPQLLLILLSLLWPVMAAAAQKEKAPAHGKSDIPADIDPAEEPDIDEEAQYNAIVLQGLNKVTGHISTLQGPVGTILRFGNLEIIPRHCWKSQPEDRPENAALLDISELKPGEPPQRIFLGWMFSSSPGLSGLEHPVYDITVLSCEESKEPGKNK